VPEVALRKMRQPVDVVAMRFNRADSVADIGSIETRVAFGPKSSDLTICPIIVFILLRGLVMTQSRALAVFM
jgi:hypothetical protein